MFMLWDFDKSYFIEYISNDVILGYAISFNYLLYLADCLEFFLYILYIFISSATLPLFACNANRRMADF